MLFRSSPGEKETLHVQIQGGHQLVHFSKTSEKSGVKIMKISSLTLNCYNSAIFPPRGHQDPSKFSSGKWLLGSTIRRAILVHFGGPPASYLRVTPKNQFSKKFNFGANFLKIFQNNFDFWFIPPLNQSELILLAFYRPPKG